MELMTSNYPLDIDGISVNFVCQRRPSIQIVPSGAVDTEDRRKRLVAPAVLSMEAQSLALLQRVVRVNSSERCVTALPASSACRREWQSNAGFAMALEFRRGGRDDD